MIPQSMKPKIKALVCLHEGVKRMVYTDSLGNLTGGIGRNLSARPLSDKTIDEWFEEDSEYFYSKLSENFYWFNKLNEARQIALIDMAFMGFNKLLTFKKMISAFEAGDMKTAAKEILDSNYARQVGDRALDIANIIESGKL